MIYVTVAGETFGIKTAKQEAMLHRMEKNYGPFMTADTVPAEKVLFIADIDRTVTVPAGEPLKTFDYALTEDAARLRIYPDRCLLSITHKASSKTFSIACPLRSDSPDDTPAYPANLTMQGIAPPGHILDHLLIFALSVAAVGKGILLIHASTIRYRGKAVMFLGESGTGKSTHSRMWLENIEGSTLLNDDAPAVRISADGTTAYGTPWSGKTPCYRAEHYPLAALVRIRRAPYNQITRLNTLQAFGAVLPSCLPTLQQDDRMLDILCDALSHMLSAVPVYTLDCLPTPMPPGCRPKPFSATHVSNEQPRSGRLNLTGAGLFSFPPLPQKPFITERHLPVGTVPFLSVSAPTPFLLKRFMVRSTPWVPNDRTASDAIPMTLRSVSFSSGSHSPST